MPVSPPQNPCVPSPCGPNSQCRDNNGQAVCTCLPNYLGVPPACRPECTVSSECPLNRACINQKCVDPCPGTCGLNAKCEVINHSPICSCERDFTGDPFTRCYPLPRKFYSCLINKKTFLWINHILAPEPEKPLLVKNPCVPSPCGANAICQDIGGVPSCSCLAGYIGNPPFCRPECSINSECQSNLACIQEKCTDPCPGSCGAGAICNVQNHIPVCSCLEGYTGDPFSNCFLKPLPRTSSTINKINKVFTK